MKKPLKPIEQATNADLLGSWPALQRAAQRACELARQTGTSIVISRDGVIQHLQPQSEITFQIQEPKPPHDDNS